jgi:hypothetical protein
MNVCLTCPRFTTTCVNESVWSKNFLTASEALQPREAVRFRWTWREVVT